MLIALVDNTGNTYHLNIDLIEAVFETRGGTSEIRVTSGRMYASREAAYKISERILDMRIKSLQITG